MKVIYVIRLDNNLRNLDYLLLLDTIIIGNFDCNSQVVKDSTTAVEGKEYCQQKVLRSYNCYIASNGYCWSFVHFDTCIIIVTRVSFNLMLIDKGLSWFQDNLIRIMLLDQDASLEMISVGRFDNFDS